MENAIKALEAMTVLAKAVPVLGAPVEGGLEILGKILRHAQVRPYPICPFDNLEADQMVGGKV
jgi:hypothetical protein